MRKLLGITLGIMTALGGFVDLGQIVFTLQAGALFGYRLLWAVVVGTIGIIVYMEMCGRVAVVSHQPVFTTVRTWLGPRPGIAVLVASNLLNLITCAAELGGIAVVLQLLTGWRERMLLVGAALVLTLLVYSLKFQWIERTFGLAGVAMTVFAVSAFALHPNWRELARGVLPSSATGSGHSLTLYAYFAVGIFSAMLMEYEVHFYSSGAIEEGWKPSDLGENFGVSAFGSILGAVITLGLLVLGNLVFLPKGIFPHELSAAMVAGSFPFGEKALVLALLGTLACLSGAAIETALSGAYNVCQFFNLKWGKSLRPRSAPVYSALWIGFLVLASAIAISGIEPLKLVNVAVIFGMVVMPFTYYPILRAAADRNAMGKHVNNTTDTIVGAVFLVLITIAALAAIPLMILTGFGSP